MYSYCIACEQRYIYRDGDEDCTKFVCSWCVGADPQKMLGKWSRLRFRILNRDNFTCKYCGDSPTKNKMCLLHIDHIRPQCEYGNNAEHNLITACAVCNLGKLGHELSDKSKEKVNEYLSEANEQFSDRSKRIEEPRNEQMENSKSNGGELANNKHVGKGCFLAESREDAIASKFTNKKKRKLF